VSQASPTIPTGKGGIVVVAAGDIACDPKNSDFNQGRGTSERCHMLATSDLAIICCQFSTNFALRIGQVICGDSLSGQFRLANR